MIPRIAEINELVRAGFYALDLMQFFTVGEKQVKSWTVRNETPAPRCGSIIHNDIEKGFIAVDTMKFEELMRAGSEGSLRKAGKVHGNGPEYIVQDSDILHFKFSSGKKK